MLRLIKEKKESKDVNWKEEDDLDPNDLDLEKMQNPSEKYYIKVNENLEHSIEKRAP